MQIIKSGSPEWTSVQQSATGYSERVDYAELKQLLLEADTDDLVIIDRPHSHFSNLKAGLFRQGLTHKKHYKLKMSIKQTEDGGIERILVIKL